MSYGGLGIDGNLTWHEFQDLRRPPQQVGVYASRIPSMTLLRRARSFLAAHCWAVLYTSPVSL